MRRAFVLAALVGAACSKPSASTPAATITPSASASTPGSSTMAPPPPPPAKSATPMAKPMTQWKNGEPITVRGKVATVIWQHIVGTVTGKRSAYFDVENEPTQTVVYWSDPPQCTHLVEVTGKVLEVRGAPKKPGRETKVDDSYAELHIDVESARCVEP